MGELPDGTVAAILRTVQRARIGAGVAGDGLWVRADAIDDPAPTSAQGEVARELRAVLEQIAEQRRSRRLPEILRTVHEPGALADAVTSWADQELEAKLAVLETVDVDERLQLVLTWSRQALAELMMAERIRNDVAEGMDKAQREFLLRQQMAAIRKELGEGDDDAVDDYRARPLTSRSPRRCARRSSARSTGSSAAVARAPSRAGSAPGSTACSSCRGASAPMTAST